MPIQPSTTPQSVEVATISEMTETASVQVVNVVDETTTREAASDASRNASAVSQSHEAVSVATGRGAATNSDRFRLVPDDEVERLPPPEPLAGPLIANTLATLTAHPGNGKTFVALDLALTVASGGTWLGEFGVRRGPVVYVVAEGGSGVAQRIRAWKQHRGLEGNAGVYFVMRAVNLLDPSEVVEFLGRLGTLERSPVLIVFDTLARCMVGAEENSAKEMGSVVAALDSVRVATGGTVLALCHPPRKKSNSPRGSSALEGAADTMLHLAKSGDQLRLSCEKQKDAAASAKIGMHLRPISLGGDQSSCVVVPSGASVAREPSGASDMPEPARQALDTLLEFGEEGARPSEWQERCARPERTFQNHSRILRDRRLVERQGSGRNTRYTLTDEGRRHCQSRQSTANGGNGVEDQSQRHSPPHPLRGGGSGGDGGVSEGAESGAMAAEAAEWCRAYRRTASLSAVDQGE